MGKICRKATDTILTEVMRYGKKTVCATARETKLYKYNADLMCPSYRGVTFATIIRTELPEVELLEYKVRLVQGFKPDELRSIVMSHHDVNALIPLMAWITYDPNVTTAHDAKGVSFAGAFVSEDEHMRVAWTETAAAHAKNVVITDPWYEVFNAYREESRKCAARAASVSQH